MRFLKYVYPQVPHHKLHQRLLAISQVDCTLRPCTVQSRRRNGYPDPEYAGISFDVLEYKNALGTENVVRALQLVRQLVSSIEQYDTQVRAAHSQRQKPLQRLSIRGSRVFERRLNGLHQDYFKICLRRRNVDAVLEYARNLPPDPHLFTILLKACTDYSNLAAVTKAVEVGFQP